MRGLRLAVLVVVAGCGESELTAKEEYYELEDRVTIDCGLYEKNYPEPPDPAEHMCGQPPIVSCVNDAIGGDQVARLRYSFTTVRYSQMREQNFYAVDGKLVWIGYSELSFAEPRWYRQDCTSLAVESYEVDDLTCWKFAPTDCVYR